MTDEEIQQYLEELGLGAALTERAQVVISFYERIVGEAPLHVLVNDYRDDDGSRFYESLWLCFPNCMCEAFEWVTTDRGDFTAPAFSRIVVTRREFDFEDATQASRLTVEAKVGTTASGISATLKASGDNCLVLADIVRDYMMTRRI
jgi:hypothetical protein